MNQITAIYPYKHSGLWVFDDKRVGLEREPFISGADTLIERALDAKGIPDGEGGFRLLFSGSEFPGFDFRFTLAREGEGGHWYYSEEFEIEGWLCPALLRYFETAPNELFAKFEPRAT